MKKIVTILLIGISIPFLSAQNSMNNQNIDPLSFRLFEQSNILLQPTALAFQTDQTQSVDRPDLYRFFNDNDENTIDVFSENGTNDDQYLAKGRKGKYKGNYFMVGTGFGPSYGGFGFKGQFRFALTKTQGIGVHAGVGAFPFAPILGNVGVKYFPYKDLYINAQFGLNGIELYETYDFLAGKTLYGPSLLIGGDWTWGKKVGVGINAAIGASYYINAESFFHFFPTMDLGFIVRI